MATRHVSKPFFQNKNSFSVVSLTSMSHVHLQVFISIALILGDGLYNFVKTVLFTAASMYSAFNKKFTAGEPATFVHSSPWAIVNKFITFLESWNEECVIYPL